MNTISDQAVARDFEKITVSSTTTGPTASKLTKTATGSFAMSAARVLFTVETDSIRIRFDGTNPDATTGHLLTAGSTFTLNGVENISNLKMIRVTTDATVQITYFYSRP
jgi:hypothetical protein